MELNFPLLAPGSLALAGRYEDWTEEHLEIVLDCRVDLVSQPHVLLQLAAGGDGGDDVVAVLGPDQRHLQVLHAVADEDGRAGVGPRLGSVLELPGSQQEAGEDESCSQTEGAGQGGVESQGPAFIQ